MKRYNILTVTENKKTGKKHWDTIGFIDFKDDENGFLKINLIPVAWDGFAQLRLPKDKTAVIAKADDSAMFPEPDKSEDVPF